MDFSVTVASRRRCLAAGIDIDGRLGKLRGMKFVGCRAGGVGSVVGVYSFQSRFEAGDVPAYDQHRRRGFVPEDGRPSSSVVVRRRRFGNFSRSASNILLARYDSTPQKILFKQ